jgi:hypothetical protein
LRASIDENEKMRMAGPGAAETARVVPVSDPTRVSHPTSYDGRLWKGWVLPASDSDTWFVAGSAQYHRVLESKNVDAAMKAQQAIWRNLQASAPTPLDQYRREQARGVLFLDSLRQRMGDEAFLKLMDDYFAAHTTQTVTAQSFLERAGLTPVAARLDAIDPPDGPAYLVNEIWRRLASAVIVYGTLRDAGANRYAAEQLQKKFLNGYESEVPIYKDFEVSDDVLRHRNVIFVGRPDANSALALWSTQLGLDYEGAVFRVNGEVYASERQGLIFAAENPLDHASMVLVVAGNDALSTVKAQDTELTAHQFVVFRDGDSPVRGFPDRTAPSALRARAGN